MALSQSDIILQQYMNKQSAQNKTADRKEASKTKAKKGWSTALNLAFMAATMGGGSVLGGIVKGASKIGKLGKVLDKAKNLQKLVKFLDAGKKTSRLGHFGTKLGNKFINRTLADILVKDTDTMKKEDKLAGYGADALSVGTGYANSWLPDSINPGTGKAWGVENLGADNLPGIGDSANVLPADQLMPNLSLGQQSALNQQQNMVGNFSSIPYQSQNIIGNTITQQPTGYSNGNSYFNLIDDSID